MLVDWFAEFAFLKFRAQEEAELNNVFTLFLAMNTHNQYTAQTTDFTIKQIEKTPRLFCRNQKQIILINPIKQRIRPKFRRLMVPAAWFHKKDITADPFGMYQKYVISWNLNNVINKVVLPKRDQLALCLGCTLL